MPKSNYKNPQYQNIGGVRGGFKQNNRGRGGQMNVNNRGKNNYQRGGMRGGKMQGNINFNQDQNNMG